MLLGKSRSARERDMARARAGARDTWPAIKVSF